MKGAASLFSGTRLSWGGEGETGGDSPMSYSSRFEGTGLYAIEVGSCHVYALVRDHSLGYGPAPIWVPLP